MASLIATRLRPNRIVASITFSHAPSASFVVPRRHCKKMIDPMEHCTGIEKRERLAHQAGNEDPFGIGKVLKRAPGTSKDCPTLVPSAFESRLVGCVCHEEQRFVQWMWVVKDMPKRCECGFWFKLVPVPPV